jgi:hypothetical protein
MVQTYNHQKMSGGFWRVLAGFGGIWRDLAGFGGLKGKTFTEMA